MRKVLRPLRSVQRMGKIKPLIVAIIASLRPLLNVCAGATASLLTPTPCTCLRRVRARVRACACARRLVALCVALRCVALRCVVLRCVTKERLGLEDSCLGVGRGRVIRRAPKVAAGWKWWGIESGLKGWIGLRNTLADSWLGSGL